MKILLNFIKFLAQILQKIGTQQTYRRIFKVLTKYKYLNIIFNFMKFLYNNLILILKLTGLFIFMLSSLNISLIYYDLNILDYINDLLNQLLNFIRTFYNKWIKEIDQDEVYEPIDFLAYKKDLKFHKKVVEKSPNGSSYWIISVMVISSMILYFYNPHIDLDKNLEPLLDKMQAKLPADSPIISVIGIFTYKFLSIAIKYATGYKFIDENGNPDDINPGSVNNRLRANIFSENEEKEYYYNKMLREIGADRKNSESADIARIPKVKNPYDKIRSHLDFINEEEKEEFNKYFPKFDSMNKDLNISPDEETPKASTSKLPDINSDEIKIEEWL